MEASRQAHEYTQHLCPRQSEIKEPFIARKHDYRTLRAHVVPFLLRDMALYGHQKISGRSLSGQLWLKCNSKEIFIWQSSTVVKGALPIRRPFIPCTCIGQEEEVRCLFTVFVVFARLPQKKSRNMGVGVFVRSA